MLKYLYFISIFALSLNAFSSNTSCETQKCTQEVADFIAGKVFEQPTLGRSNINFSLINDSAYGIYEVFTGRKMGDDFGNTHGVILEVGHTNKKGVNYKLVYMTNLYTERASERYQTEKYGGTYDQYFTEENIFKVLVNNKNQQRSHYYEVGFGVVELNKEDVRNWLFASGQQKGLHDGIGSFHPNNLPRDNESEFGSIIQLGSGKQFIHTNNNKTVRIIGDIGASGTISTIRDGSSATVSAGVDYYYQRSKSSWAYKMGAKVDSTVHQTDSEPMNNFKISMGVAKGNYSFELLVNKIFAGHKQNFQDFNYDREATVTIQFSGKFGAEN